MTTPLGIPRVLRRLDCPTAEYETELFFQLSYPTDPKSTVRNAKLKFNLQQILRGNYNFYDAYPKHGAVI